MRYLKDDMRVISNWVRCRHRPIPMKAIWCTTGAVYMNIYDLTKTVSSAKTPILVSDLQENMFQAISIVDFKKSYTTETGAEIDSKFINTLKNGDFIPILYKEEEGLWSFHVVSDLYRADCPYGANKAGTNFGTGDHLVCPGISRPEFSMIRLVTDAVYTTFYEGE